jgi:predicted O-methyltransferase YrrM
MSRSAVPALALLAAAVSVAAMNPAPFSELSRIMRSFQESRLLLSAVELDIFTAAGTGATAPEIAAKIKAQPRSTETFLNALVAVGALVKDGARYRNTPETARYLVAGSPDDARDALLHTVHGWDAWSKLTDAVRLGTAPVEPGVEARDAQWTESFIAAMHRNAAPAARALAESLGMDRVRRVLDVGGGSGAYSIAFAQANPALRAEVLDLAPVTRIAERHIREAGLSARVTTRVGDLTADEFGKDYDLILLSAICHMLDEAQNQDLFRRSFGALAPGGRLVIRDFILDADKTSPRGGALFAVHMLVQTRGGSNYSEAEYRAWLTAAGFSRVERPDPAGDLLIATR